MITSVLSVDASSCFTFVVCSSRFQSEAAVCDLLLLPHFSQRLRFTPSPLAPPPGNDLPVYYLRLLAPPLQLLSAAVWQVVQQGLVDHYGMLEEFVTMVTELVPELMSYSQRAQLIMGLRARVSNIHVCVCVALVTASEPHFNVSHVAEGYRIACRQGAGLKKIRFYLFMFTFIYVYFFLFLLL